MDDKEFYLDAIKGIVPEQKEVQLQNVSILFWKLNTCMILQSML